jgi:hypothetical protein
MNDNASVNRECDGRRAAPVTRVLSPLRLMVCLITLALLPAPRAFSQPTQEEVFKSIGDTVNEPIDASRVVATLAAIGGVVVLLVVVGHRRGSGPKSKSLDHPGKLMKEVLRNVPLKGVELKQIKLLSQELRPRGSEQRVQSPLTLLLCPSLLGEAAKQSRGKADLPVVAGLVKKLVSRQ